MHHLIRKRFDCIEFGLLKFLYIFVIDSKIVGIGVLVLLNPASVLFILSTYCMDKISLKDLRKRSLKACFSLEYNLHVLINFQKRDEQRRELQFY